MRAGGAGGQITTTGSVINYTNGVNMATPIAINSNTTQLQALAGVTAEQSGVISEVGGARPLEKIGDGTLFLSAANTYTGTTTVSSGALALTGAGSLASTDVDISNGGTLRTDGGRAGGRSDIDVAAGGTLDIDGSENLGTLSALDLNGAGASLDIAVNQTLSVGTITTAKRLGSDDQFRRHARGPFQHHQQWRCDERRRYRLCHGCRRH